MSAARCRWMLRPKGARGYAASDRGRQGVCAQVTQAFLDFTRSRGNDLTTPDPWGGFPGLKPADRWCLCADRWQEADRNGVAPPVVLATTHQKVLDIIPLERLQRHSWPDQTDAGMDGD